MPGEWHLAVCAVCFYVDGDARPKMCFYCSTCGAWICEDDADQWGRRALASARRLGERMGAQ